MTYSTLPELRVADLSESLPPEARARLHRRPQPDWIDPMLATLTHRRFSDPNWLFELKFDGERCLAFRDGGNVMLFSRLLATIRPPSVFATARRCWRKPWPSPTRCGIRLTARRRAKLLTRKRVPPAGRASSPSAPTAPTCNGDLPTG